jgi:transcriptional regulator with XRE-family HTH domain
MPRKPRKLSAVHPIVARFLADRKSHGETLYGQAHRLGLPISTLYYLEQGKVPRAGTILAIENALGNQLFN